MLGDLVRAWAAVTTWVPVHAPREREREGEREEEKRKVPFTQFEPERGLEIDQIHHFCFLTLSTDTRATHVTVLWTESTSGDSGSFNRIPLVQIGERIWGFSNLQQ